MRFGTAGPLLPLLFALLLTGCGEVRVRRIDPMPTKRLVAPIGLKSPYHAVQVISGLRNPTSIAFKPDDGLLTIAESGAGRVIGVKKGVPKVLVERFITEYLQKGVKTKDGRTVDLYRIGPLGVTWLRDQRLVVTTGGRKDGRDVVMFFGADDPPRNALRPGARSNPIAKTTKKDPSDKGEGDLVSPVQSVDGKLLLLGCNGTNAKTWLGRIDLDRVARGRVQSYTLEAWGSADENGIATNAPAALLVDGADHLLVLYTGAMKGKQDGLLVRWSLKTGKPVQKWTLPGLVDPVGLARIPGDGRLVVCDINFTKDGAGKGRLAIVEIGTDSAAKVAIIADALLRPTCVRFGPDGHLYVAELGGRIDRHYGRVLRISGFGRRP